MAKVITLDPRDETVRRFFESLEPTPDGAIIEVTGRNVFLLVRPANGHPADNWTDSKNDRRGELIDCKIAGTITPDEEREFEDLQQQMRNYRNRVAPLPLEEARQLYQQLLDLAKSREGGGKA